MIKLAHSNTYINKGMKTTVSVQKIIHFISTIIKEDFVDKKEKHDFWEIVYLESGEAEITSDNEKISLLSGEVYFHKPGQVHSIRAINAPITVFFISFDSKSKVMAVFEDLKTSLNPSMKHLVYKIYDEARNIFEKGSRADDPEAFVSKSLIEDPPLGAQQLYKVYIEEFLLSIAREVESEKSIVTYTSKESLEKLILERIIELITQKVYSSVSIDEICKTLNYSRTYLTELFKKYRKTSIMNYYNMLKVKEAKKLLRDKGYSVSLVSRTLGFCSPYYFSKVFKKYEEVSPSEYKITNPKGKKD